MGDISVHPIHVAGALETSNLEPSMIEAWHPLKRICNTFWRSL